MDLGIRQTLTALIFAATYVVLGLGRLPLLRIDRTGAALVGAILMIAVGAIPAHEAAAAIDLPTLALLFGMMVVIAHLELAGFFGWLATRLLRGQSSARGLLFGVVVLSGTLSAFFVNDTVCLLLTPVVLELVAAAGLPAMPFLLAVAMGANAGSVATVVGNPQNMLISHLGRIAYLPFASALAPVGLGALALTFAALAWIHRRDLDAPRTPRVVARPRRVHTGMMRKASLVAAGLLAAMLLGVAPSLAALGAAAVLLITRRVRPERVHARIDWSLLAMFAGLFVVIAAVERSGLLGSWLQPQRTRPSAALFIAVSAALSNLVSNVPAVLLLKGWALGYVPASTGWLLLAMASTLAGNLTLVGSVANLIVVQQARHHTHVGFWEYARVGIPLTILSLLWGAIWLLVVLPRLP